MEQIVKEEAQTAGEEAEVTEQLEANAEQHESNDSEGASQSDAQSSSGQVLTDEEYQEYRKLKRLQEKGSFQKDDQNGDSQKGPEVASTDRVEELEFKVLGVADEEAKKLAKDLVKSGVVQSVEDAVNHPVVQHALSEKAEAQAITDATPAPSKRVPTTKKDTVEYWIGKDELPDDQELRFKVIEAERTARSKQTKFGQSTNIVIK